MIDVPFLHWRGPSDAIRIGLMAAMLIVTANQGTLFAADLLFKKHVINADSDYSAAALIDVNQDGRLDIVCGGDWYEAPNWTKHFVADVPRIGGRPDGFAHLEFDVNRDGWTDVITVNYRSRSIKWMEHPGASLGPWTTHIAVEPGPMETGRLVDVDGDGQLDLLPNGASFAAWWEFRWNDEERGSPPAWIRHDLPHEAGGHGLGFGDVDGDGHGDIVGQNGWLQAPLDARNGEWLWHAEFTLERASIPMIVVDVDQNGLNDIVWCSAHGFGVYWLEQLRDDEGGGRSWTRHAIDTSWSQGHSPLWADLDGDGRGELITGKRYMAHGGADPGEYDPIAIYRYQFEPTTRSWNRWIVSPLGERVGIGLDPKIADMDGDGDLDLMASGRSGLYWLENQGSPSPESRSVTPMVYDRDQNLLSVKRNSSQVEAVTEPEGWGLRRLHITSAIEGAHDANFDSLRRVPLDLEFVSESSTDKHLVQTIRYRVEPGRSVTAMLWTPHDIRPGEATGLVCRFGAAQAGQQIAAHLADRGFVCLMPTGEQSDGASGQTSIADEVWNVMRAADVLQAMDAVHGERIGYVGDARSGQLGIYVAALDQRFIATLTDASDAVSWESATVGAADDLGELLAATAPRSLRVVLPQNPGAADLLKQHWQRAEPVYGLRKVADNLSLSDEPLASLRDNDAEVTWLESRFRRRLGPPPR